MAEEKPGYTPIFDDVAEAYGMVGAGVFGLVWRYSTRKDGFCHAGVRTMAKKLRVNEKTVRRWLATLCADGMIVKTREHTPYKPAGYICAFVPSVKMGGL